MTGPLKISLEDYLFGKGVGFVCSDYMLDKLKIPHGLTLRQKEKLGRDAQKAEAEYQHKRQVAIQEYRNKVVSGEIVEPTRLERTIRTAQGHPDNAATQAARRILAKRGIDWKNCP